MTYENCKLGAVQSQDGGWGFNVFARTRRAGGYADLRDRSQAQEAHDLMAKVIAGAAITPHSCECAHAARQRSGLTWLAREWKSKELRSGY